MKQTGGCACGEVRYVLNNTPLFTHACHCKDCQRTTGSAFLINMMMAENDFQIEGKTNFKALPTASGNKYEPHFCPECGAYLWARYYRAVPGIVVVRAGTLDDASRVKPQAHIFTRNKQTWVQIPDDVPVFEEMYDRNDVWPPESLTRLQALIKQKKGLGQ